jgi:hypothetical protein
VSDTSNPATVTTWVVTGTYLSYSEVDDKTYCKVIVVEDDGSKQSGLLEFIRVSLADMKRGKDDEFVSFTVELPAMHMRLYE